MSISYDTSQLNTLIADLNAAPARAGATVKVVIAKGAKDMQRDAQLIAPVDTGNLVASIRTEIFDDGFAADIIAGAEYAPFVEEGTSTQAPQPFMAPAFDRNIDAVIKALGQATGF